MVNDSTEYLRKWVIELRRDLRTVHKNLMQEVEILDRIDASISKVLTNTAPKPTKKRPRIEAIG
jgi:hypothetical protein